MEGGAGVGGGLEASISDSVGDTDMTFSLFAEASLKAGLIKATAGYEKSRALGAPCSHSKVKLGVGLPLASGQDLTLNLDGHAQVQNAKFKKGPSEGPGSSAKVPGDAGMSVSAKAGAKLCAGVKW